MDAQVSLLDQLLGAGLLFDTGVDGLYGRAGVFEDVVAGIERMVIAFGREDQAEVLRFPPGMNRAHFEASGYMKSFPHLAGTVHCFCGDEAAHGQLLGELAKGEDWTHGQKASDIVITPAACYPLYPLVAKRGRLKPQGGLFDLCSYCFRHEPSTDPARMQMFRMREYVRVGSPEQVMAFRQDWIERGKAFVTALELPHEVDLANDPFFGRGGRLASSSQREQGLKFELLIPVNSVVKPTACLSFNYHQDHFGELWGIEQHDGTKAHTACVGFGLERITLALFRHHGFDVKAWPAGVRTALGLA
ncbi:MAG: amino acid--[acyl-carrier-protein] ligase [Hyphomicrobiales bacterium]|nr:MAG: amino acid--[acyl-carrier-protein] ligase [Hyphomicrobiales bacterium]